MTTELEQKLIEKYPILFQDKDKSPKETLMCFGIETGDGWYKILDNLFGYFYEIMEQDYYIPFNKEYIIEGDEKTYGTYIQSPKVKLVQVKEKYGTLRVYFTTYNEETISEDIESKIDKISYDRMLNRIYTKIDEAVNYSEYISSKTCEVCGDDGTQTTGYWISTLCPKHMENK
jgi:hypothetical protein